MMKELYASLVVDGDIGIYLHADTTSFVAYNSEESEPSFSIVFFNIFHNVNTPK